MESTMFAVVSCKKFSYQSLRVVDYGTKDCKPLLDGLQCMECPICGPCSHVEMSWEDQFIIHSEGHETVEAATEAGREHDAAHPGMYDFPLRRSLQGA